MLSEVLVACDRQQWTESWPASAPRSYLVPTVVFHCSLSQQRGPKSARIYSEARKAALEAGKIQPLKPSANESESDADAVAIDGLTEAEAATAKNKENGGQAILVLRDGFANFGRLHKVRRLQSHRCSSRLETDYNSCFSLSLSRTTQDWLKLTTRNRGCGVDQL